MSTQPATPIADPAAVIQGDSYRITVLTDRLLRLEYSPTGVFEDRPTQVVMNRGFAVPDFRVERGTEGLVIRTPFFHLVYDEQPFSPSGLRVQVLGAQEHGSVWRYGEPRHETPFFVPVNLGGTARTLDEADGACALGDGIMGSRGYAELDDSASLAIDDDGWVAQRAPGAIDTYVFCHGYDFRAALVDFYALTGPQPLLPRFALGNWWSRYHRYTDAEYRELIERFEAEELPFAVAVIDMDWHVTDVPSDVGSGWTGFTWNTDLFPDPPAFLAWLHEHGLRTTLNVHPADGIRRHEERYAEVATAMGIDPASGQPVTFDIADPRFVRAYFEKVIHPLEDQGVDFWWLDWQQGSYTKIPGLDPLWLINHLHFHDSARRGRPLTFSRYAGPGSHRYPIGFSGDTVMSWASLDFQPYFTATASNIGYGWWSHDIGGHMFGVRDDELATRWVQLGAFSPINRLHSTLNPFTSKEPWRFNAIAERVMGDFLRLRHRMLPYLYTMNGRAHADARPLVEPLYYSTPTLEALGARTAFHFGSELLVAAITTPLDRRTLMGSVTLPLPPGVWIDMLTGVVYDGGRTLTLHRPLEGYPVLAKAGAIVPLTGPGEYGVGNPRSIELRVFAGADGDFTMYEDDDAADPRVLRTRFTFDWEQGLLHIHPAEGELAVAPATRDYTVILTGVSDVVDDRALCTPGLRSEWDAATGSLRVEVGPVSTATGAQVRFCARMQLGDNDVQRRIMEWLGRAQLPITTKDAVWAIARGDATPVRRLAALAELRLDHEVFGVLTELLAARA